MMIGKVPVPFIDVVFQLFFHVGVDVAPDGWNSWKVGTVTTCHNSNLNVGTI